jgi:hypothetical protein
VPRRIATLGEVCPVDGRAEIRPGRAATSASVADAGLEEIFAEHSTSSAIDALLD